MADLRTDLVLEGGGVKGIGLVGAVAELEDHGYQFQRVAGTSAGAVIGCLAASGFTGAEFVTAALGLDYKKFLDPEPLERVPLLGPPLALLTGDALFKGDYALQWLERTLATKNVVTFADLALDAPSLPPERRYRLVVTATDITLGQLVHLPWDFERVYGLDPDAQSVAYAVRSSMSIPFLFRPTTYTSADRRQSTLVDGGLVSNFPVDCLDRTDGARPRWPTFGVNIMPHLPPDRSGLPGLPWTPPGALRLVEGLVDTVLVGRDQAKLDLPWVKARTIGVDTAGVGITDFGIRPEEVQALVQQGRQASRDFLEGWNWEDYVRRFRTSPTPP